MAQVDRCVPDGILWLTFIFGLMRRNRQTLGMAAGLGDLPAVFCHGALATLRLI